MALPGLSLPGLISSTPTPHISSSAAAPTILAPPRTEELSPRNEYRFEVAFGKLYKVRLVRGTCEVFGTELAVNQPYSFSGTKAAIFTWHGCTLELQGEAESEYVSSETEAMVEWMNVHGMMETLRDDAQSSQDGGPRTLVVGPDANGKSSLIKCLTSWAVRMSRAPTVINLDPREGILSIPSSLTATTYNTHLDPEDSGWGSSSISGPTGMPTKTPLVYHYPFSSPDTNPTLFKTLTTRLALAVTSKLEEDPHTKSSGMIIDTPGTALNSPKNNYELLSHIVSEFSINVVLALGSERLYNDLQRKYSRSTDEAVTVLRIAPSPGAVARDPSFMASLRTAQLRQYFFGDARTPLNPHSQMWDFSDLAVYKAVDPNAQTTTALNFMPGTDDDDEYDPGNMSQGNGGQELERFTPGMGMVHAVLAIKFAAGSASLEAIKDAGVMGFVYVADVDETKKKVRVLAPHPNRWGDRALVWGPWPEGVGDLVA